MKTEKTSRRGVRALKNGRYRLRIFVAGRDYVRTIEAKSVKEAAKTRDRIAEEIRASNSPERLSVAAEDWLKRRTTAKRPDGTTRLAPSTIDRYTQAVRGWIIPLLGSYDVRKLKPSIIRDWRDSIGEQLAASTVNGHLLVLRQLLAEIDCDAAKPVSLLEADDTRITDDEPNLLTRPELARFLEAARSHHTFPVILFLLVSGARVSTALAARWDDVDPSEGVIHLRRRLSRRTVIAGVKRSRKSKDMVPLLPSLHEALLEHREKMTDAQRSTGLLFPSPRPDKAGAPITRQMIVYALAAIKTAAGLTKRLTVHGLRRTAALHYRLSANTAWAKEILGHQTDAMHRRYAPEQAAERVEAAERAFGDLLAGSQPKDSGKDGGDPEIPRTLH